MATSWNDHLLIGLAATYACERVILIWYVQSSRDCRFSSSRTVNSIVSCMGCRTHTQNLLSFVSSKPIVDNSQGRQLLLLLVQTRAYNMKKRHQYVYRFLDNQKSTSSILLPLYLFKASAYINMFRFRLCPRSKNMGDTNSSLSNDNIGKGSLLKIC